MINGKPTSDIALHLQGVTYLYPSTNQAYPSRGVHSVTLGLVGGGVYGLIGHNGAGKSTLFKLLSGELYAQSGHIYLYGTSITKMPMWKRARLGLGYLGQSSTLVDTMTVEWNLDLGLQSYQKWRKNDALQSKVSCLDDELIRLMEISHLLKHKVRTLSGGERRRVEMARVLFARPQALILDEPFAALDQNGLEAVIKMIKYLSQSNALVLLTDHQTKYVNMVCQQIFSLHDGKLSDP